MSIVSRSPAPLNREAIRHWVKLPLPYGWEAVQTNAEDRQELALLGADIRGLFFFNTITKEASWDEPAHQQLLVPLPTLALKRNYVCFGDFKENEENEENEEIGFVHEYSDNDSHWLATEGYQPHQYDPYPYLGEYAIGSVLASQSPYPYTQTPQSVFTGNESAYMHPLAEEALLTGPPRNNNFVQLCYESSTLRLDDPVFDGSHLSKEYAPKVENMEMFRLREISALCSEVKTYDDYNRKSKIMSDIFPEIVSLVESCHRLMTPHNQEDCEKFLKKFNILLQTYTKNKNSQTFDKCMSGAIRLINITLAALNNVPMAARRRSPTRSDSRYQQPTGDVSMNFDFSEPID